MKGGGGGGGGGVEGMKRIYEGKVSGLCRCILYS